MGEKKEQTANDGSSSYGTLAGPEMGGGGLGHGGEAEEATGGSGGGTGANLPEVGAGGQPLVGGVFPVAKTSGGRGVRTSPFAPLLRWTLATPLAAWTSRLWAPRVWSPKHLTVFSRALASRKDLVFQTKWKRSMVPEVL